MHSLCGQGPALATQRLLRKYAQMKARILKYTWNYGMIYHLVGRATNKSGGSYSDLGDAHWWHWGETNWIYLVVFSGVQSSQSSWVGMMINKHKQTYLKRLTVNQFSLELLTAEGEPSSGWLVLECLVRTGPESPENAPKRPLKHAGHESHGE